VTQECQRFSVAASNRTVCDGKGIGFDAARIVPLNGSLGDLVASVGDQLSTGAREFSKVTGEGGNESANGALAYLSAQP
jgi:hypothetical protein